MVSNAIDGMSSDVYVCESGLTTDGHGNGNGDTSGMFRDNSCDVTAWCDKETASER
jgi:hypothetical protein